MTDKLQARYHEDKGLNVIKVLLTAKTDEERLAGFEGALASKEYANRLKNMVGDFKASPQLAERYEAAKAVWEAEKAANEAEKAAKKAAKNAELEAQYGPSRTW
jgi:hypothetical protein